MCHSKNNLSMSTTEHHLESGLDCREDGKNCPRQSKQAVQARVPVVV
jgi:hypothetical protein